MNDDTVKFINGHLEWRDKMPAEERRRNDDKNWEAINKFIEESRAYRIIDASSQKYQGENLEALKNQVKIANGRTFELEKWREHIQATVKAKEDAKEKYYKFLSICATIVSAVAALIMIFKH